MKLKVGKIVEYIFICILILIVILMGIIFIKTKTNPEKIPSIFGYKPFIVMSGSMETELYKGDLVFIKNIKTSDLKEGDIIAFKDEDNYVITHRIVKAVNQNGNMEFITKGDSNNTNDNWKVTEEKVEGIYKFKISNLGSFVLFMQQPSTLIITLAIIIIGGLAFIVIDNEKLSEAERKELEEFRKNKTIK